MVGLLLLKVSLEGLKFPLSLLLLVAVFVSCDDGEWYVLEDHCRVLRASLWGVCVTEHYLLCLGIGSQCDELWNGSESLSFTEPLCCKAF